MSTVPDRLLWTDIETSDSDEAAPNAMILEVGLTLTDLKGEILEEKNFVNSPRYHASIWAWDPVVVQMHANNGLLEEVRKQPPTNLDTSICKWLDEIGVEDGDRITLAGSGVSHFDRRWIKLFLPNFDERLTHYAIDVGVMRRMLAMHAPKLTHQIKEPTDHRALHCNRVSIEQYVKYVRYLNDYEDYIYN